MRRRRWILLIKQIKHNRDSESHRLGRQHAYPHGGISERYYLGRSRWREGGDRRPETLQPKHHCVSGF